jgi:hypothetical protein
MTYEMLAALFDLAHNCTGHHDEGTRRQLERLGLTDDGSITPRGHAFIEHVCALPLPERVTAWRVPRIAPNPAAFMDDFVTFGTAALHINGIDEEGEPPSGPPPKPFASRIEVPTDPELLKAQANALLDRGMSMGEIERELSLTPEQATAFFRGR